jgi:hypothetical protein
MKFPRRKNFYLEIELWELKGLKYMQGLVDEWD